jgi:hypothetical protein
MIYISISAVFIIAYIFMLVSRRQPAAHPDRKKINMTAGVVRAVSIVILCAVPGLCAVSTLTKDSRLISLAVAAATIQSGAVLLIGLMALLQRYGSLFFKMPPALGLEEILVTIILPVVMYLTFLPSTYVVLYYLGPAFYTGYLMFRMVVGRNVHSS